MGWGILVITIIFIFIAYTVLQGTRASLAWRKAAAAGDVEVIKRMLDDAIASWRSMKRPKEVAPDIWRGVQSVELVDVTAESARLSCQAESEYRMVDGRWAEVTSPLQEGMAVTVRLVDMILYDVPNLRLASSRIDVYSTFRSRDGIAERVCILSTNARRDVAREVDWEEWSPAEIIDAFGGRYRIGERGAALPIDLDDGVDIPAARSLEVQAEG